MRRLIVNADDLGADEDRDAGIFEAIHAGVVTSVSLLPNGPTTKNAIRRIPRSLRRPVSWGIHVNLSEGRPLSKSLRILTLPEGSFRGKDEAHHLLMEEGNSGLEEEIRKEIAAQIEVLREAGVCILHLDGHQHVHVFPAARRAVAQAVREFSIPWVRLPEDLPVFPGNPAVPEKLAQEAMTFSRIAAQARGDLETAGIHHPDHFRGLYLKENFSLSLFLKTIHDLPPGLTEMMVHPGRARKKNGGGPFSAFSTADRERELEALLHPGFRRTLDEIGILLIPFPESP